MRVPDDTKTGACTPNLPHRAAHMNSRTLTLTLTLTLRRLKASQTYSVCLVRYDLSSAKKDMNAPVPHPWGGGGIAPHTGSTKNYLRRFWGLIFPILFGPSDGSPPRGGGGCKGGARYHNGRYGVPKAPVGCGVRQERILYTSVDATNGLRAVDAWTFTRGRYLLDKQVAIGRRSVALA